MTTKKTNAFAIIILLLLIFTSCVNLKEVNSYSSKAATGIKKFEEIGYSFTQRCFDRWQMEAIKDFDIKRETEWNCTIYKTADSIIQLLYNAINGYFDGLVSLSDNNLTYYNFDALRKALPAGEFGSIKIGEVEAKAYSKISGILLRAATDVYRQKKLTIYIEQANQPIQVLLSKLQFILQKNLVDELSFKKEKLFIYYKEMSLGTSLSAYEKGKATIDYYQQLSDINQKQKQIDAFARGLKSIGEGHQKLYDNRTKLTSKNIKQVLLQYSSDIQDVIAEFNTLKNK
jgi:hypothetical protein